MSSATGVISARVSTLGEVFSSGPLRPADVQREYSWDKAHCVRLYGDLSRMFRLFAAGSAKPDSAGAMAAEENEFATAAAAVHEIFEGYFLGPVVLSPDGDGGWIIYDGQQRLTTLTILACIARDLTADEASLSRVHGMIEQDGRPRLILAGGAGETLAQEIQRRSATQRIKVPPDAPFRAEDRLRAAARYFRDRLRGDGWSDKTRAELVAFFCDHIEVAVIEVRNESLARQVFETTNGTGKALDSVDIFKGQIIDLATQHHGADVAEQYAERWQHLRERMGDVLFAAYLRAVDFITRKRLQGPDYLNRLFAELRQRRNAGRLGAWLDRLERHADTFLRMTLVKREVVHSGVDAQLLLLYALPWWDWQPLALHLLIKGADESEFSWLQRACWIMALAQYGEDERAVTFEKAFYDFRSGGEAVVRPPNDAVDDKGGAFYFFSRHLMKARETLSSPIYDYDLRRAVTLWLEATHWGGAIPGYVVRDTSVEHVLPESPPPGSQWRIDFRNLEARNVLRQEVGNLCIVPHKTNVEELQNFDFAVKQPILAALGDRFKLAAQVAQHETWTGEQIAARNRLLLAHAQATLKL